MKFATLFSLLILLVAAAQAAVGTVVQSSFTAESTTFTPNQTSPPLSLLIDKSFGHISRMTTSTSKLTIAGLGSGGITDIFENLGNSLQTINLYDDALLSDVRSVESPCSEPSASSWFPNRLSTYISHQDGCRLSFIVYRRWRPHPICALTS